MQKTYKCNSCGVSFLAEESPRVVCPHCQSDDTEPEKEGKPMKKIIIIAVCVFVLAIGLGALVGILQKNSSDKGSFDEPSGSTEQTVVIKERAGDRAQASASEASDEDTLAVASAIEAELLDSLPVDVVTEEVVAVVEPETKPAEDLIAKELQSKQKAEAEAKKKEQTAPKATEPEKIPTAQKLTNGQVQSLIDKVVSSGSTKALTTAKGVVNNVKVDFVSIDGEYFPSGISSIINNMNTMEVKGYRVENVGYDSQNKVNHITLRPIR